MMKKIIFFILIILIGSSCMKDPEYHILTLDLVCVFEEKENIPEEYIENAKVTLNNLHKNYSVTQYTDAEGKVFFSSIEPGFYSVILSHSFLYGDTLLASASESYDLFSSAEDTMIVTVVRPTKSFIIKEFYYSGCETPSGNAYSADQYVEIYNNTDEVLYADGLSIVEHESYGIEPNYWEWLKDSIVVRAIFTIPGEGTDYPVQPGESIVIARDAFDHKSDPLGNPLCPVDLAYANFEFFIYSASGDDIDGAYSPNMIENLFTFRGNDYVFHVRGGSAIALVQIPGTAQEREAYINTHLITKDAITSDRYYGKIPNDWVIDAVEVVFDEAHAVYKRFPIELDVGYTYNPEGSRSGLCIRRKVKSIVNGNIQYQDTNNSCEDFIKGVQPKPWIYDYE